MRRKLVFYASAKDWNSESPVGSHGYAREFLRQGWTVVFISVNLTPWHRLLARDRDAYHRRIEICNQGGRWSEGRRLLEYVPWSLVHCKWLPKYWQKFDLGRFERDMKRHRISDSPAIVWVDTPEFGCLFDQYPNAKHIFRVADKNRFFSGVTKQLMKYQIETARAADTLIVTSFALEDEMKSQGLHNVLRVENAVDRTRFLSTKPRKKPPEYTQLEEHPIALYVGEIQTWFDLEMLKHTALKLPKVNFVIIGKVNIDISLVTGIKNIIFLGPRDPNTIIDYMEFADIGIIPFERSEFVDAINPVKYYEYIACGLPVVSSRSYEFEKLRLPVFIADHPEDFSGQVELALHTTQEEREHLRKLAHENTWSQRWRKIMNSIEPEE